MTEKQFALVFLPLYCVLILTSLGDPGMTLSAGRSLFGDHFDLVLSIVPYAVVALLLVYLTFVAEERRAWRFIFLILISVALFFVTKYLYGEEEKVHLIEFALFGGVIFWAASVWGVSVSFSYAIVAAAGVVTVGLDESIQMMLSLKFFTVRDVLVNFMSTVLGAFIYAGLFGGRQKRGEDS